ncbi:hypothetical protein Pla22_28820 [Rubripirellula amarantea]|uniref:Uncharacterized protein n=1 Tax=Rubripirellula amarantea TaxID=2527999 RepID=A0A5C5WJW4_9BACT|nr:hypothetical protein Pla22_28820 [Rubripirellula amarantea]
MVDGILVPKIGDRVACVGVIRVGFTEVVGVPVPSKAAIVQRRAFVPSRCIGQNDLSCTCYQVNGKGRVHGARVTPRVHRRDLVAIDVIAEEPKVVNFARIVVPTCSVARESGRGDVIGLARINRDPIVRCDGPLAED